MNLSFKKFARLIHMEKPENYEEFLKFIETSTGLKWQKEKSFLAMNLQDLKDIFARPKQ